MIHRTSLLIPVAVLVLGSPLSAQEFRSDVPQVVEDTCPFESSCNLFPFLIRDSLPVYATRGDRSVTVGFLSADDCAVPAASHLVAEVPGVVVLRRDHWGPFVAGDTLYVLSYAGEGSYYVWSDGRFGSVPGDWSHEIGSNELGETLRLVTSSWWIRLSSPVAGWIGLTNQSVGPGANFGDAIAWGRACSPYRTGPVPESGPSAGPLFEAVAEALREHNPRVGRFAILDIATLAPGGGRYALIGYGVRSDHVFEGDFNDELFGIFIADSSRTRITRTLEILPTPRWLDYEFLIERLTGDSVIISGRGATYGGGPMRRSYSWSPWLQR